MSQEDKILSVKYNESKMPREKIIFGKGLSKLEIAAIHINSAIKMLFDNMNPVSVHTVVSSGYQIIRDLAQKAQTEEYLMITNHIKDGHLGEFWSHINKAWRFFKHANKDPEATFEGIDELVNDFAIFMSIRLYKSLGQTPTREMNAFIAWFICMRSELMYEGPLKTIIEKNLNDFNADQFSRAGNLSAGKTLLEKELQKYESVEPVYEI
ncbi:MAG: hypothetical protein AB7N80_14975 [Bdellovibrionales bacterium]